MASNGEANEDSRSLDSEGGSRRTVAKRKIAPGVRIDFACSHETCVDGNSRKIQCNFSGHDIVSPSTSQLQMHDIVYGLQERLIKKTRRFEGDATNNDEEISGKGNEVDSSGSSSGRSIQPDINPICKESLREEACLDIASFFYNNAIPLNVTKSEEFSRMFEKVAQYGLGFQPPTSHELRVKFLKQKVDITNQSLEEHKAYWKKTGCTIMIDRWTNKRRRTILNFLVNSPKGTVFLKSIDASHISETADKIFKMIDDVVEEIGEENVVQVVTDNAANYKAAGEMLMEKRRKLYWTPCVARCIDLMLEDFEKKLELHKETISKGRKITTYIYSRTLLISLLQKHTKGADLVRPGMTYCATSYLTLGCLHEKKSALIRMFTSDEWKSSKFSKTRGGEFIENVVLERHCFLLEGCLSSSPCATYGGFRRKASHGVYL